MSDAKLFDPTRYLSQINGREYLEVRWRLVWLRAEHPDAHIKTELVSHANDEAVFCASVSIPGGGSATGWGSEDARSFGDYLEKAETKAIGRALAALGFGTQFCADFDFGAGQGRVVDTPVELHPVHTEAALRPRASTSLAATSKQYDLIQSLRRSAGVDDEQLNALARERTGRAFPEFTRQDASLLIDYFQSRRKDQVS